MKMLSVLGSIFSMYEYFVGNLHSWLVLNTEQARSKKRHHVCCAHAWGLWCLEEGQSTTATPRARMGFPLLHTGPRGAATLSREPPMLPHTTDQQGNAEDGDEP